MEFYKLSIVIPVFNDLDNLKETLDVLYHQKEINDVEVIVVNNGSTHNFDCINAYPRIKLIHENHYLNSPYSSRNRGIESSKSEFIAFLDASCIPSTDWLENVLKRLIKDDFDIFAGDVRFSFKNLKSASELYDSKTNIKMKYSVEQKGYAKTTNLFIRKNLFEKLGFFKESIRSGEDVRWTKSATENGIKIGFIDDIIVYKKTRCFKELMVKQYRVAKGIYHRDLKHKPLIFRLTVYIKQLFPPKPSILKEVNQNLWMNTKYYFVAYFVKITMLMGFLSKR